MPTQPRRRRSRACAARSPRRARAARARAAARRRAARAPRSSRARPARPRPRVPPPPPARRRAAGPGGSPTRRRSRSAAARRRARGRRSRAPSRARHPAEQAAQAVELEPPTACASDPAPRNSRPLNSAWLTTCRSAAASAKDGPGLVARSPQQQRRSQPEDDHADVLDGAPREQPLQLAGERRVDGARRPPRARRGRAPARRTRRPAARDHSNSDAHQPVDRDLHQHAAHQRRDVRRRDRVRPRQPGVERHRARPWCRSRPARRRARAARRDRREARVADGAGVRERQQRDPDPDAAQVRDGDVGEDGPPRGLVAARRRG